jgi:carboxymethylenebutenolidase
MKKSMERSRTGSLVALAVAACLGVPCARAADPPALPASEATAARRLEASPRHGEILTVDVAGGPVRVWVVHPERKDRAPVVVVVHEVFGLTPWIRAVADEIAAAGFLAVAPDLLSGKGPGGGGTDAYASRDDARAAVSALAPDEVLVRLNAVRAYALRLPAASDRSAAIGFCWGGATTWAWAAAEPALDAAVVYYGTAPADAARLRTVRAPVLGLYGGEDARVTATVEATREAMRAHGRRFESHVFDGAGHGFLRAQEGQDGANRTATERAWPLSIAFLRRHAP